MARQAQGQITLVDVNDGPNGLNNATIPIYIRSPIEPTTTPTGTGTYTFSSGELAYPPPVVTDTNRGLWIEATAGSANLPTARYFIQLSGSNALTGDGLVLFTDVTAANLGTDYQLIIDGTNANVQDRTTALQGLNVGDSIAFTPTSQTTLSTSTVNRIFEIIEAPSIRTGTTNDSLFMRMRLTAAVGTTTDLLRNIFSRVTVDPLSEWSMSVPAGTGQLWQRVATASSRDDTDTITPADWSSPLQISGSNAIQANITWSNGSVFSVNPDGVWSPPEDRTLSGSTTNYTYSHTAIYGNVNSGIAGDVDSFGMWPEGADTSIAPTLRPLDLVAVAASPTSTFQFIFDSSSSNVAAFTALEVGDVIRFQRSSDTTVVTTTFADFLIDRAPVLQNTDDFYFMEATLIAASGSSSTSNFALFFSTDSTVAFTRTITTRQDVEFLRAGTGEALARLSRNLTYDTTTEVMTISDVDHPVGDVNEDRVTVTSDLDANRGEVRYAYAFDNERAVSSDANLLIQQRGLRGAAGATPPATAIVNIYTRSTAQPTTFPTLQLNYTVATATATFQGGVDTSNGWYIDVSDVPAGTGEIWQRAGTVVTTMPTGTIATTAWAGAIQTGSTGANGQNGLNNFTTQYFQRTTTTTAPSLPNASATYTFSTGVLTPATNNGWSTTIPGPASGRYLWRTVATASSRTDTDTIPSTEWGAAAMFSVDGTDGLTGASGDSFRTVYLFQNGTSTPTAPASNTGFTTGGVATNTGSWTTTATAPTAGQIGYVASANLRQPNSMGNWVIIGTWAVNPASTSGTNGTNGDSFRTVYLYDAATTQPTSPGASAGFTTAGIATNTGTWTTSPPSISPGESFWIAIRNLRQPNSTGSWVAVDSSWTVQQAGRAGTNGSIGTNGAPGPRFGERTIYTNPAVSSAPSTPSATITWSTGVLSSITSGWSETPPTVVATSGLNVYSSTLVFIDTTGRATSTSDTGTTPVQSTNFSGLVTFTGGDFAVDGSTITSIDGSNLTTGTVTADIVATGTLVDAVTTPTGAQSGFYVDSTGRMTVGDANNFMHYNSTDGLSVTNNDNNAAGFATTVLSATRPTPVQHGLQWVNTSDASMNFYDALNRRFIRFADGAFVDDPLTLLSSALFTAASNSTINIPVPLPTGTDLIRIWAVGGGGSGGATSTDGGREKVSSGGGAGGTALVELRPGQDTIPASLTSANVGTGGAGVSASGSGGARTGNSGGNSSFIYSNTLVTAFGGSRGSGSRQSEGVADNSTAVDTGAWGFTGRGIGGGATGGDANYTGGGTPGFSIGGDGSAASGGGSTNFGLGGALEGLPVSGGGFVPGAQASGPLFPSPFINSSTISFRGGAAQQHSSGGPVTGAAGALYGAGGGSGSAESSTATSGAGANGMILIQYLQYSS